MVANRMVIRISPGGDTKQGTWAPGVVFANELLESVDLDPKIKNAIKMELVNKFTEYLAKEMAELLQERIKTQYRSGSWAPLTPRYAEYKRKHGLSPNIWESTGFLCDNIISYKYRGEYIVGIDPSVTYDNGVNLLTVATSMEFGTDIMPARPLFRPVVTYMRRHVRSYWNEFLLIEEVV